MHSRVRQQLFGADRPEFTGVVAWRAVVPIERLPAHMARRVGSNWVGPGGHIVHYPLRAGRLMNFVGALERSDWRVESWSSRGTQEELAADFRGWHDDIQAFIAEIETPYKWALMVRAPLERPRGADGLCRQFEGGGGREAAAGINWLPEADYARFVAEFAKAFP